MAVFNEPPKWATNLGKDADVVTIPDTAGATDPDIKKIFPAVFSIPLANGGKAVPRKVLNALFKLVGDCIFYMQNGGFWSYNSAFDYAVGRVVLYTDGNLYKCIQANTSADPKAPTDSAYWLRITTTADSPTSEIKIWPSSTIPDGFLLCNGSAVSRTTYANLFSKIGTTFGSGDGSTTFNIPDLRDRYVIGANTNALGTYIAEQLPNIRGNLERTTTGSDAVAPFHGLNSNYGALSYETATYSSPNVGPTINAQANKIILDAHDYSSVYVISGKVYPLSLALNFIIKT